MASESWGWENSMEHIDILQIMLVLCTWKGDKEK